MIGKFFGMSTRVDVAKNSNFCVYEIDKVTSGSFMFLCVTPGYATCTVFVSITMQSKIDKYECMLASMSNYIHL